MKNYRHVKDSYYCDGYVHYETETYEHNGKYYCRCHVSGDGYDSFEECPTRVFDTKEERDAYLEL